MSERPFRWDGYEIDREKIKEVERAINTYPHKRARLDTLRAKWTNRPDYDAYRSPQGSDGMPGAPGATGDPTGNLVAAMDAYWKDQAEILYLESWVNGFEMVMTKRLNEEQRRIIMEYVGTPSHIREKRLGELARDMHIARSQAYNWLYMALLEFAWLFLPEGDIRKISGQSQDKNAGKSA